MSSDLEFDFSEPTAAPVETRDIYTPGRLNREARTLLERGLPALWLEGEMSNLSRPSSGHWYFSLKDESAQLRCAMFRQRNLLARFTPKDGAHVLARGRVSLYEPRGDYQFLIDHIEEAGEGALRQRFELLKNKLAAEGLFAAPRKRALPRLPRRIGIITSPTGAAIRDVLHILRRRFCTIPVLVYPAQVQGASAASQIAATIRLASRRAECDVLILARGGGSLEDLWAFNEEIVARAIFECAIPVVSGIGHEVDFTIADFVADVRAPTPSGAAELVAPDCNEWIRSVSILARRSRMALTRALSSRSDRSAWLQRRLAQLHPGIELRQRAQRLDELEQRLLRAARSNVSNRRGSLMQLAAHLRQHSPALHVAAARGRMEASRAAIAAAMHRKLESRRGTLMQLAAQVRQHSPALHVAAARGRLEANRSAIDVAIRRRLESFRGRMSVAARTLDAVSPLATLQRGYAIVVNESVTVVTDATTVRTGETIRARLARGSLVARVEQIEPPSTPNENSSDDVK